LISTKLAAAKPNKRPKTKPKSNRPVLSKELRAAESNNMKITTRSHRSRTDFGPRHQNQSKTSRPAEKLMMAIICVARV
jgi:uncharacterized membrane protein